MVTFRIHGVKELQRKLTRLKSSVQKKVTRSAVSAAIRPVRMAAKSQAPKETGQLKKALTVKVKTYKSGNVFGMVSVKNEKDAATGRRPSKYLHLVALGTKIHTISTRKKKILVGQRTAKEGPIRTVYGVTVKHPGSKKDDFLTPALESKATEALAKFANKMRGGILAAARGK